MYANRLRVCPPVNCWVGIRKLGRSMCRPKYVESRCQGRWTRYEGVFGSLGSWNCLINVFLSLEGAIHRDSSREDIGNPMEATLTLGNGGNGRNCGGSVVPKSYSWIDLFGRLEHSGPISQSLTPPGYCSGVRVPSDRVKASGKPLPHPLQGIRTT